MNNILYTYFKTDHYLSEDRSSLISKEWTIEEKDYTGCIMKYSSTPKYFMELMTMLKYIVPTMSIFDYAEIDSECVTTIEETKHDYYGVYEINNHFVCDLNKLYECLTNQGHVTPDNEEDIKRILEEHAI